MRRVGPSIARWSATLLFAFVSSVACAAGGEPPRGPQWSILHKSDTGLSLSFVIPDPLGVRSEGEGRRLERAVLTSGVTLNPSELPQHTFTFLLPANTPSSSVRVTLESPEWVDAETGALVAPESDVSKHEQWLPENPIVKTEFTSYGNYILLRATLVSVSSNPKEKKARALRSGFICVKHPAATQ